MSNTRRTNYNAISTKRGRDDASESMVEETPIFKPFYVKEKDVRVRIRMTPSINGEFTGMYLGDGLHEVVEVRGGEGSETGWGRLASGTGWVALDYLTKESK